MKNINKLNSVQKLIISLIIGVIAFLVISFVNLDILPHLIFGWDIFSLCLLILTWMTFFKTKPHDIRTQAQKQDNNWGTIFSIILAATCISMLAVILLLISGSEDAGTKTIRLLITVGCMLLSWILVHTIFTLRYAHMYYSDRADRETQTEAYAVGIDFPDEDIEPDFIDFSYFSFTLGMTFQVSDVEISSPKIRRLALWHALLSFGYNATIIALSVNIIGGLTQK